MSATDVVCPVCMARQDEPCRHGPSRAVLEGKAHKQRVKLAREVRQKMLPHWRKGNRS